MARARADVLGLNVNDRYLDVLHAKYRGQDELDPQELTRDFILGCCPDITVEMAHEYLHRVRQLVVEEGIAYDCSNIGEPTIGGADQARPAKPSERLAAIPVRIG